MLSNILTQQLHEWMNIVLWQINSFGHLAHMIFVLKDNKRSISKSV